MTPPVMRCPFAAAFASPVPGALAVCMLVVVPTTAADAEPKVRASRQANTTEPAPRTPIVKSRAAPGGTAILDIVGPGDWCSGLWTAAETGRELTFGLSRDRSIALDGTCAFRLTVTGLSSGRWTFRIGTAQIAATAR